MNIRIISNIKALAKSLRKTKKEPTFVYNINVHNPAVGKSVELIGKEIVKAIQQYENVNGKRWRQ
jgi:hypothetical protein